VLPPKHALATVPNPTQIACYKWLLRYLFAGDTTPPPEPPRPTTPAARARPAERRAA